MQPAPAVPPPFPPAPAPPAFPNPAPTLALPPPAPPLALPPPPLLQPPVPPQPTASLAAATPPVTILDIGQDLDNDPPTLAAINALSNLDHFKHYFQGLGALAGFSAAAQAHVGLLPPDNPFSSAAALCKFFSLLHSHLQTAVLTKSPAALHYATPTMLSHLNALLDILRSPLMTKVSSQALTSFILSHLGWTPSSTVAASLLSSMAAMTKHIKNDNPSKTPPSSSRPSSRCGHCHRQADHETRDCPVNCSRSTCNRPHCSRNPLNRDRRSKPSVSDRRDALLLIVAAPAPPAAAPVPRPLLQDSDR
ncbi:hypothetical protein HDU67_004063 [Dinochytrium kinnereticum]|nr:hypothetical protein HDU67_004063 [Dinochytrium kinnereticum]